VSELEERMTAREFLTNVTSILTVMAVGALLETAVPMFGAKPGKQDRRTANLGLTALSFVSNWLLASLAATAALALRPAGLMAQLRWPVWIEIVAGIVVLDFSAGYLSHRTMHMWPAMWRFHQIHHSDPFVDVTTTYRTHPVETVWRFLFAIVPVWILGIPAQAVLIQRLLQATNGIIEHADVRLWAPLDRVLSLVWVTPNATKFTTRARYRRRLELRQPADALRQSPRHVYPGRPGEVGDLRARRGGPGQNVIVSVSAFDAFPDSEPSART
jgi:sterol desaturase/sphingolipid hydroxylase (fatty acid hydroxylase superfamily)